MTLSKEKALTRKTSRRLFVYNSGFLIQKRTRRILTLSGYDISLGKASSNDLIGVWGQSPNSWRGEAIANCTSTSILCVEDAFLRSVLPGRSSEPPLGLHLDTRGVHFDPSKISDLEMILQESSLDDSALLGRAQSCAESIKHAHLSKYNAFDPDTPAPDAGYVLVIDQTAGDASVTASRADRNTFLKMLLIAHEEHPSARILIKTHPETAAGYRDGHYQNSDVSDNVAFISDQISPHRLLDGAIAVYTVSSQYGFEAIMAGHTPIVFGQPFYVGWGLTDDRMPLKRRQRNLTRAQLFAGAMILYPVWYDPYHDELCSLETAVQTLEAHARAWRDDRHGWVASGMRLWKRAPLQKIFGQHRKMIFEDDPDKADALATKTGRSHMVWAGKATRHENALRVEDGFLRSRGLGANLIAPLSLVLDDLGIYYDPNGPSRLESYIEASVKLPNTALFRAERLVKQIMSAGLSKYNLTAKSFPNNIPKGRRILVPGQVEDDASIQFGTTDITTNLKLLQVCRVANPTAVIIFKPHPDVEAGLRTGAVPDAADIADVVLTKTSPIAALDAVDAVWTMTSTIGFEALLRGKNVTCLGIPFYAGWGLTDDHTAPIPRRTVILTLAQLAHAVLIDYPRYYDPISGLPCPAEVIVKRLQSDIIPHPSLENKLLSKIQGMYASYAHLWR
ncbi:MAG: capsular polysaccharide biosynthesis protein [Octadecabacter sp.]|nr:capsular polysaccharide biosynthesis protein [Octadecabacter sp.]